MIVSPETLLAFSVATFALISVPGPTIITVITQVLTYGKRIALASVAGVAMGDLIAAGVSIIGFGSLLSKSPLIFTIIKLVGAIYLIYLAYRMWAAPRTVNLNPETGKIEGVGLTRLQAFTNSFLVTVLNPKGIVFFIAFVPQFINTQQAYIPQAIIFTATFAILGGGNAFAYAMITAKAKGISANPNVFSMVSRAGAFFLGSIGLFTLTLGLLDFAK